MKRGSLLDSIALLAYLKREGGFESAGSVLRSARARRTPVLMNEVNVGEVYCSLAKSGSIERAEASLGRLHTLPIRPLSNTLAHVLEAARLPARSPISYADAFAVATAQREDATLVTGDRELHAVEHLVPILWI